MTKICYSYLFGDKDVWRDPLPDNINHDWTYVLFTDQDIKSDVYQVKRVESVSNPQLASRHFKLLGAAQFYPEPFKKVFHHDANIRVNCDLDELPHFMIVNHPFHHCAYKEIELCKKLGKANRADLERTRLMLREYRWNKDAGLYAAGLMMRPNTRAVDIFSFDWFHHAKWFTHRDQIFLPYLLAKHNITPEIVEWSDLIGSRFLIHDHA